MAIERVAVIGAGVMGASIAAHVANAGLPVVLLDIVAKDNPDRSAIARGAIEKLLKADPAPFMSPATAKLVTPGNIEDDLTLLADCDLIIEAVIERLDIKQGLYQKLDAVRKDGSIVSSNTSTIPLKTLIAGLPERFARDFMITHFFNPPRYMRLLELVGGDKTRPEALKAVAEFGDRRLGKTIVPCRDTPGFIANRLGVLWMTAATMGAVDLGLDIEEADAIMGKPLGVPKTGIFGLMDLVGIDLGPHVNASLAAALPKEDLFQKILKPWPLVDKMSATGYTGRKGKGGFYRINRDKGKVKEAVDLATGHYRTARKVKLEAVEEAGRSILALITHDSTPARYARQVMGATLAYAALLIGDASDDVEAVDTAMKLGYNWKWGPFELIDKIGVEALTKIITEDGWPVAPILEKAKGGFYRIDNGRRQVLTLTGDYRDIVRPDGVVLLDDIKLTAKPIVKNAGASLWDIGDGVACLEIHTKMNALDIDVLEMIKTSLKRVKSGYKAMVIYNEGSAFSAGANIGLMLFAANMAAWSEIERMIAEGQQTMKAMKYAPFPVVAAPFGLVLGGGCEIVLHASAVQAHAETYAGLVEVGVGVIPGWGGCKEMLARWQAAPGFPKGPMPAVGKAFEMISTAQVAKSAAEARDLGILRPTDGITMNRDRLLADAKTRALAMVEGYQPPTPPEFRLPGPSGATALAMAVDGFVATGKATKYDSVVAGALARTLTGGDTDPTEVLTEDRLYELEREGFMSLVRRGPTLDRIETMLETGKPLRN